ncbi:ABC transporter ATP-binding protein [Magnetospirillum gryphiswaldense]|uniref:High-affinity branched-chain amino acid ABC transporter (ATP-binding protein) n=2 Tax=Magnetospirillum gryphiswaldense TaxID=55518 RepID=V6F887_MAGGM|nr:ABC transporter ATP-binding protein [Magnetospirillum gryphiswaldense]AVM75708.1 High-affinity branched-chain amino acid transport ATP-binding protein LivF [Magnetospirillum gryphiswaldense MSR-1]AVM79611.1 High-affinity branched-chain amino acid transport ATP-binding protein LivF [Magnetospirillum gryphiswaldense]CAM75472.1 branched-chain amino acid ABC transporter, ATP-binding protein [Magnetospirillum gryphiswaldense MSR-1]CDL00748.1 high-affinity branched-chain amino acid ABC transporter
MLLEIQGLESHYGRVKALKGVDVAVKPGELVALVGANGAGKTTLLRALSGVQSISAGSIRFDGHDITRLPAHKRVQLGIAQVPEGRQVFGPMSVEDNLLMGTYRRRGAKPADDMERMYDTFPILKTKRKQAAGLLSGGQQQMLAMARALMSNPRLLLLDEPSMGLAPLLVGEIFNAVERLKAQGMTILLVEQNAFQALGIADRGYVMETGDITMADDAQVLLGDERVKAAYLGL